MKLAQKELDHQLTIDNAFQWNANQTKSSELTCSAQHANGANLDLYQTQPEDSASNNQDHQSSLESHNAEHHQYITTIELNVFHAQLAQFLQPTRLDVLVTAAVLKIFLELMDLA